MNAPNINLRLVGVRSTMNALECALSESAPEASLQQRRDTVTAEFVRIAVDAFVAGAVWHAVGQGADPNSPTLRARAGSEASRQLGVKE